MSDATYNEVRRQRYAANPERQKAAARKYYADNREAARQQHNRWRAENPEQVKKSVRKSRLKSRYGLTPEGWDDLFRSQGRCCAVCRATEPGSKRGWHTDHCHETKEVRGILCLRCNVMLGHIGDGKLLQAALSYIGVDPLPRLR